MQSLFTIKGVNPEGRIVQLVIVAASAAEAKALAQDAGLRHVIAKPAEEVPGTSVDAPKG